MSVEILRRIGEQVGLIDTPEKKEAKLEKVRESFETIERVSREQLEMIHMLTRHSDAFFGEIEYVLGTSSRDPHPNHPIEYTKCDCEPKD